MLILISKSCILPLFLEGFLSFSFLERDEDRGMCTGPSLLSLYFPPLFFYFSCSSCPCAEEHFFVLLDQIMYYYTLLDDWDSNHFYEQKPIQSFVNTIFLIYAPIGSQCVYFLNTPPSAPVEFFISVSSQLKCDNRQIRAYLSFLCASRNSTPFSSKCRCQQVAIFGIIL